MQNNDECNKDCSNCQHGQYSDKWDCLICYEEDCIDWNKWEQKEEDND